MVTEDGGKSVHAFVDRNTGDVYMAASWKAPRSQWCSFQPAM